MSFGIDFGTTNTAAFRCADEVTEEIGDETRHPMPSVVAINKFTGEVEIGRNARKRISLEEEDGSWVVVRSLKRELARNTQWNVGGRVYSAVDLTAELLRRIATQPLTWGGSRIGKATLGVPVRMLPSARRRLKRAASLAGIEVSAVLKESTAACIKHRALLANLQHAAVFDWGGGTLDISVIRVEGTELTELWSDGCDLAGDDLDLVIARHILGKCREGNEDVPEFDLLTKPQQLRLLYEAGLRNRRRARSVH
jgi:molecular chaperone DnaK